MRNEQIERNRLELVLALRSERYEQCTRVYTEGPGTYCFVGLSIKLFYGLEPPDSLGSLGYSDIKARLGLKTPLNKFGYLNDDGKTFPELADILVRDYGFPDVYIDVPTVELEEVAV